MLAFSLASHDGAGRTWPSPMLRGALARFPRDGRFHGLGYLGEIVAARRAEKAAARAGVAGGTGLIDQQQQRIAVAIDAQLHQTLHMARAFALAPELLARARPVADAAGLERLLDRFAIHPGQHQHLAAVGLLRPRGDETLAIETQAPPRSVRRAL